MAIVETEFIRQYPQHRKEVEDEMRFKNMSQQEAEQKIARKNNLKHPSAKTGQHGRWIKMLKTKKMAGAVMSTTAGLESKPRYSKKKKDEEMKFDIEEHISKAEKKSTKRFDISQNVTVELEFGNIEQAKEDYKKWKDNISALEGDKLGITGHGHDKEQKTGKNTLLEYLQHHVKSPVNRPKTGTRKLTYPLISKLDSIFLGEKAFVFERDKSVVLDYIDRLKKFSEGDNNPRNIPFTQPKKFIKLDEPKTIKVNGKDVKIEWEAKDTEEVRGHYRTPKYIEARKKLKNIDETIGAVNEDWYSGSENQAKPPFWQAIYSDAKDIKNGGKSKLSLVDKGLLRILQDYVSSIKGPKKIIIKDAGNMKDKIKSLLKLTPMLNLLEQLVLRDKSVYRANTSKLNYSGATGILTRLNNEVFNVQAGAEYLADVFSEIKDVANYEDAKEFQIIFTKPTIDNLINAHLRSNNKFLAPKGTVDEIRRPFQLGGKKRDVVTGQSWSDNYKKEVDKVKQKIAQRKAKRAVKKGWVDSLWG